MALRGDDVIGMRVDERDALHFLKTEAYVVLVKVMLSSITVAGPTGTCTGLTIFRNWILSVHTFLRKSSKTLIVNCSAGQRRYPKPNGANPAWSHTGTGLPSTTP
jgi:hypothetical protein